MSYFTYTTSGAQWITPFAWKPLSIEYPKNLTYSERIGMRWNEGKVSQDFVAMPVKWEACDMALELRFTEAGGSIPAHRCGFSTAAIGGPQPRPRTVIQDRFEVIRSTRTSHRGGLYVRASVGELTCKRWQELLDVANARAR